MYYCKNQETGNSPLDTSGHACQKCSCVGTETTGESQSNMSAVKSFGNVVVTLQVASRAAAHGVPHMRKRQQRLLGKGQKPFVEG